MVDMKQIIKKFPDIETQTFLEYVDSVCRLYGAEFRPVQRKNLIHKGQKYAGEFDFSNLKLRVAIATPPEKMLPILVHEFSHFKQLIDEDPIIYSTELPDGSDAYDNFMQWVSYDIDLPRHKAVQYGKLARNFEINCDKRALEEIKYWDLPLDHKKYVQQSNSYHLLYNYIAKHRFWPTRSPYEEGYDNIWQVMPTKWIANPDRPTPRMMQPFDDFYGKGK